MPPPPRKTSPEPAPLWSWKPPARPAGERPGLLYEPGNWGDVLKGTWAVAVTRALAARGKGGTFGYLDPFAGAATYPLTAGAARRLRWLGARTLYAKAQAAWAARQRLASTALLVREAARAVGSQPRLSLFDLDPERMRSWRDIDDVEPLAVATGEEALRDPRADLVLVDPYDLFDRPADLLPSALELARRTPVLLYLHNRAARGGGHARAYDSVRRRLREARGVVVRCGRVPSDPVLPRSWHEVILLWPDCSALPRALDGALARLTSEIARRLAEAGCYETGAGE